MHRTGWALHRRPFFRVRFLGFMIGLGLLLMAAPSVQAKAPTLTRAEQSRLDAAARKGAAAAADGRWADAARWFEVAVALDPVPVLAWNHARALERAGALQESRDAYEVYLAMEGIPDSRRADTDVRIAAIDRRLWQEADRRGKAGMRAGRLLRWARTHVPDATVAGNDTPPQIKDGMPVHDAGALGAAPESDGASAGVIAGGVTTAVGAAGVIIGAVLMADASAQASALSDPTVFAGLSDTEVAAEHTRRAEAANRQWVGGIVALGVGAGALIGGIVTLALALDGDGADDAAASGDGARFNLQSIGVAPNAEGGATANARWRF